VGGVARPIPITVLGLALAGLTGCAVSGPPVPPTYTPAELRARCERGGGWWHPDALGEGYCEPNSQM
jgi:hypothetical protein